METAEQYALKRWPDDPNISHAHREGNRIARQYFRMGAEWRATPLEDARADLRRRLGAPPSGDEREALIGRVEGVKALLGEVYHTGITLLSIDFDPAYEALEDAVRALRRQGPITDEWEYGWAGDPHASTFHSTRGEAEEFMGDPRHFRRRKAGPWEPVEAARDAS